MGKNVTVYFDGASKGNPGPSGIGALILEEPNIRHEIKKFIGVATNNQAEYSALLEALHEAKKLGANRVQVFSDSELVIFQLNGRYQIKDPKLKLFYEQVRNLIGAFDHIKFTHIPREKNKEADALANLAVKNNHSGGKKTSSVAEKKSSLNPRFFEFCHPSISREEAEIMILGLPYEGTVNSRPGAINGPKAIREACHVVESYSPFFNRDLCALPFYDDGDIQPFGKGKAALDGMADEILKRLPRDVKPVFLGGDHTVSYSAMKALAEQGKEFSVVHLDAHPDSQDAFEGDEWCYATFMRRSKEFLRGDVYQLGVRTCTKPEWDYAVAHHKVFSADRFVEGALYVGEHARGKNIYVTFDIDVLDPSLAAGTSNPEYGGLMSDQIRLFLNALKEAHILGFDIVEVAPNLDPSGLTPIIAAEIARDAMLAWWGK